MEMMHPNRRLFLVAVAATLGLPAAVLAKEGFIDLDWSDLVPAGQENIKQTLQGMGSFRMTKCHFCGRNSHLPLV